MSTPSSGFSAPAPAASAAAPAANAPASNGGSGGAPDLANAGAAGGDPKAAAAAKPTPPAKPATRPIKVNGKVLHLTDAQIEQRASLSEAAQERFQEAAQMRKQAEAVLSRFRDPRAAIQALQDPSLGLTKEQIREAFEDWYTEEFVEPETLTPEQKKLREYEAQIKRYADEEKSREEQKVNQEREAMTAHARQELQAQIIDVIETGGLPKTNFTVQRIAHWMRKNHQNGFNAPTELIVAQVRRERDEVIKSLVDVSDGASLIQMLGDDIINKIRRYDLDQLRAVRAGGQPGSPNPDPAAAAVSAGGGTQPRNERGQYRPTSSQVNEKLREMQRTGKW
jgi:hypothetical protein